MERDVDELKNDHATDAVPDNRTYQEQKSMQILILHKEAPATKTNKKEGG